MPSSVGRKQDLERQKSCEEEAILQIAYTTLKTPNEHFSSDICKFSLIATMVFGQAHQALSTAVR